MPFSANFVMKKLILIVFIIVFSCTTQKQEEKVESTHAQLDNQFIYGANSRDEFLKMLPTGMSNGKLPNKKFAGHCPPDSVEGFHKNSMQEKGTNNPFDTSTTVLNDTVHLSFKVSNDCCLEYFGGYKTVGDSLFIYFSSTLSGCDCYCDYQLEYWIPRADFKKNCTIKNVRP
jgi:hypothetical protein